MSIRPENIIPCHRGQFFKALEAGDRQAMENISQVVNDFKSPAEAEELIGISLAEFALDLANRQGLIPIPLQD